MIGIILCLAAFLGTYAAARHSLVRGLGAMLLTGYFYGFIRAWVDTTPTYFLFDLALIGLYLARLREPWPRPIPDSIRGLQIWMSLLVLWPLLLLLVPVQPYLVQLVGFRCAVFFLLITLLGVRLTGEDLYGLAMWLAGLNLVALAFGLAEYTLGIERFIPVNAVTALIYASDDVAGYSAHRIPAIFVNAHAYGGSMVATVPFLVGAWVQARRPLLQRVLAAAGLVAAMVGVLMSAARIHFAVLIVLLIVLNFSVKMKATHRVALVTMMLLVGLLVASQERLQRFTSLQETSEVSNRVAFSLPAAFWEVGRDHPMGNGLGGGGTNMPYFLAGQVHDRVVIENEYGRILFEEGWVGLLLWLGFVGWVFTRRARGLDPDWVAGRRMGWVFVFVSNASAFIGTGLLVSIPQSVLMLLTMGWIISGGPQAVELPKVAPRPTRRRHRPHLVLEEVPRGGVR